MKELIEAVIFAISLLGVGSYTLHEINENVRKIALEKVAHGLPSLTQLNKTLRTNN
jgi:hypothetical protein